MIEETERYVVREHPTDIRIRGLTPYFPFVRARTPLKFGAVVVEALDFCHVRAEVENRRGQVAEGWGAMFLMDMWAWPSDKVAHDVRMEAMRALEKRLCELFADYEGYAHPVEIFTKLEGLMQNVAWAASGERNLAEGIPFLATLVCASPIDLAIHDAFGKVNGISTWDGFGREHMNHDLSRYLGAEFKGAYIADFLHEMPARIPCFHLVGGLDKLRESEITADDPRDGLPVSLDQWIRFDRLRCLKVKIKGSDLGWDLARILEVAKIAREEQRKLGYDELYLTADTNEQCQDPDYCIELLERVREIDPLAFDQLLYLEQPTGRDLGKCAHDMRPLAALKPVIIDESLVDLASFELAMNLGWSGIALKACKCLSPALLFACKAERMGIPYTVQDLTNPGIALIASVGMAGHLRPMKGVEANSRQFFPGANEPEAKVHPGVYKLEEGQINTTSIKGPGLGYRLEEIGRTFE